MIKYFMGRGLGSNKLLYKLWQIYFKLVHPNYKSVREIKLTTKVPSDYLIASYYYDRFENKELDLFLDVISPSDIVVDCGAHIGIFSLNASTKLTNGKVYAFEPNIKNYNILCDNIILNEFDNIVPSTKAASNKTGLTHLQEGTIHTESKVSDKGKQIGSVKLDDLFDWIDVIKIDVEGHEAEVLEGMKKIIKKNPDIKIFMEVTLDVNGEFPDKIKDFIWDNRFYVKELNFNGWQKDIYLYKIV